MPAVKTEIGHGLECTVYDIGNGRCYKEYIFPKDVDSAYRNAKIAFEAGIAPEVYERDENGYYTEIVETFEDLCGDCEDEIYCDEMICEYALDIIGHKKYYELCATLCEVFSESAAVDLHIKNIGLKDNKLVAIDFGNASDL